MEVKLDLAFVLARDADARTCVATQILFEATITLAGAWLLLGARRGTLQLLGLADREALGDDSVERPLPIGFGLREDRPRVAGTDDAIFQRLEDRVRKRQQPQCVGYCASALAYGLRHLLLIKAEIQELLVGACLLDIVEVLPLEVLDDRDLERFLVRQLANNDRNRLEPRLFGRAQAALASHDLVAVTDGPYQDRLEHASLRDRSGQLCDRDLVEPLARLQVRSANLGRRH